MKFLVKILRVFPPPKKSSLAFNNMNILDKIVAQKQIEIASRKLQTPVAVLEQMQYFSAETLSLYSFLLDPTKTGIIAEYKRKSPSKGIINDKATVEEVTMAYAKYGASGISVLTDNYRNSSKRKHKALQIIGRNTA